MILLNPTISTTFSKSKGKPSKIPINLLEIYRIFWVLSWIEFALLRFPRQRYKIYLVTCESLHCLSVRREFWKRQKHTRRHTNTVPHTNTQHTHHHSSSFYNHDNLVKQRSRSWWSRITCGRQHIVFWSFCDHLIKLMIIISMISILITITTFTTIIIISTW